MARFAVDGVGAVVMFFFRSHALVAAADGVKDLPRAQHLAQVANGWLLFGLFGPWLWIYLAATALVYGWYCLPYIRRYRQTRQHAVQPARAINEIVWKRKS